LIITAIYWIITSLGFVSITEDSILHSFEAVIIAKQ
jgi:hypothetical protein